MKILNEFEQLKQRSEEVYEQSKFQEHYASELERKSENYADRFFKNSGKARVYKWRAKEAKQIANTLYEYYQNLRERMNVLESKQNGGD